MRGGGGGVSEEYEYKLYAALIRWTALVIVTLIVCISAYNITDITGPVRPKYTMDYHWPNGTPPRQP